MPPHPSDTYSVVSAGGKKGGKAPKADADAELDALMAELDAPKAATEGGKKKKKKGKGQGA